MGMVSTMNVVSFEEIPVFFSLLVSECCGSRGGAVPSLAWWEREGEVVVRRGEGECI